MKHKTWFRLILKAIGVLLVCLGLPDILNVVAVFLSIGFGGLWGMPAQGFDWSTVLAALAQYGMIGALAKLLLGLYLLFGGKLIVDLCIPSNRPYCPDCGFELRVIRGDKCSECGIRLPMTILNQTEPVTDQSPNCDSVDEGADASHESETIERVAKRAQANNRRAEVGFVIALLSLIPGIGIILGPAAIVYGIEGSQHAVLHPDDGGVVHARVAFVLGCCTTALNLLLWGALTSVIL